MVDVGPLEPTDPDPAEQQPLEGVEEYVARLHDAIGPMRTPLGSVLLDIATERIEQDAKWGEQNHRDGTGGPALEHVADLSQQICQSAAAAGDATWKMILQEKVSAAFARRDTALIRTDLVEVAATAAAWIQAIDRRIGVAAYCEKADAHRMAHVPTGVPPTPAVHDVPGSE